MSQVPNISVALRQVSKDHYDHILSQVGVDLTRELEANTFVLLSSPKADRFVPAPLFMRTTLAISTRPSGPKSDSPADTRVRIAMDMDTPCATPECQQDRQLANQIALEMGGQELQNCTGCQVGKISRELLRVITSKED